VRYDTLNPGWYGKGGQKDMNGAETNRKLEEEMQASLVDGKLPCAEAFRIAKQFKVVPREVGDAANTLKIKISGCQLGCFP